MLLFISTFIKGGRLIIYNNKFDNNIVIYLIR